MKVYHGTTLSCAQLIKSNGILLSKCKEFTDFYKGFYVSEHFEFAKETAIHKEQQSKYYGKTVIPAVVELDYDDKASKSNKYSVKEFTEENLEWLQFIINNRNGIKYVQEINETNHNLGLTLDIVKGRIADGCILNLAEQLRRNNQKATISDLRKVIYSEDYATQISFHTPSALKLLTTPAIIEGGDLYEKRI